MQLIVGILLARTPGYIVRWQAGQGGLCGRAANNGELLTAGGSIKTLPFVQPHNHRCTQHVEQISNSAKYRVQYIAKPGDNTFHTVKTTASKMHYTQCKLPIYLFR